ncbi:MAG: hypothetical protein ABSA74_00695 [Candidatus Staskawiczbacteria bacterium]|jgi:hypothetical protein
MALGLLVVPSSSGGTPPEDCDPPIYSRLLVSNLSPKLFGDNRQEILKQALAPAKPSAVRDILVGLVFDLQGGPKFGKLPIGHLPEMSLVGAAIEQALENEEKLLHHIPFGCSC